MADYSNFLKEQLKKAYENIVIRCFTVLLIAAIFSWLIYRRNWPEVLYSIPLTLLSIVGYSIFQAREFHKFLSDTMLGIIQNGRYLKNLNRMKLDDMLKRLHQIYYELPEDMERDSLYQFVKNNVLDKYIGEPYIEEFETTWEFHNYPAKGYYQITNLSHYRIVGSKDKETEGTNEIKMVVSPMKSWPMKAHFPREQWYIKTVKGGSEDWVAEDMSKGEIRDRGFYYDLKYSVSKESPLQVECKRVGYEQAYDRTAHQIFSLPTHGLKMTIIVYDFDDVKFNLKFSGIPPSRPDQAEQMSDNRYVVKFRGWMIPGNSVTITF